MVCLSLSLSAWLFLSCVSWARLSKTRTLDLAPSHAPLPAQSIWPSFWVRSVVGCTLEIRSAVTRYSFRKAQRSASHRALAGSAVAVCCPLTVAQGSILTPGHTAGAVQCSAAHRTASVDAHYGPLSPLLILLVIDQSRRNLSEGRH